MHPPPNESGEESFQYEAAYARIEQILEELNTGQVALERSLQLYEEADQLISQCAQRLQQAEQRVALLIKKRNGELATDTQGRPLSEEWDTTGSTTSKDRPL